MKRILKNYFKTRLSIEPPRFVFTIALSMSTMVILFVLSMIFLPWQQTTSGDGRVIALDPNGRIQEVHTAVSGIISKWHVQDGDKVKKGDPIVDVLDNDPLFLERLSNETEAKRRKVEVSKMASKTSEQNYLRQESLFKKGLSSQRVFEKAKIEYKKLLSQLASDEANLAKAETTQSRQLQRSVTAPADGSILRVISGAGNLLVKEGDSVAQFLPEVQDLAVEIFINGNDFPLIEKGKAARIQFEGWPAIQATGWPGMAIGTFGGVVWSIDSSRIEKGRYRVLVVPDDHDAWPNSQYLRQGTRVHSWVVLDTVKLGYELWRRFNGFPLAVDHQQTKIKK